MNIWNFNKNYQKVTQPFWTKLIPFSAIKARYPVGDKSEECDSTRENSSKSKSNWQRNSVGGSGGGIICQRCQDVKRGPLKRIQVCDYCKEWRKLQALLPRHVEQKKPTEVSNFEKYIYTTQVTTLRPALPGFATCHWGPIGVFCHFDDFLPIWRFWRLLAIFLAHFDPWTICDNSLQWHFLIGPAA